MSLVPAFFGKLGSAAGELFKPKKTLKYDLKYQFQHKHTSGDVTWTAKSTTSTDGPAPNAASNSDFNESAVSAVVNSIKGEYKGKDFNFESEAKTSDTISAKVETSSLFEGLKATLEAKYNEPRVDAGRGDAAGSFKTSRTTSTNVKFAYKQDHFAGDAKFDYNKNKFNLTTTGVVEYEGLALGGEIKGEWKPTGAEDAQTWEGQLKAANFAVNYQYNGDTTLTLKSEHDKKKSGFAGAAAKLIPSFHYRVNKDAKVAVQLDIPLSDDGAINGRFGGSYRIDGDSFVKGNIDVKGGKAGTTTVLNTAYSQVLSSRAKFAVSSQINIEDFASNAGQPHKLGFKLSLGDF